MDRLMVSSASVLRIASHIVFRFDETRQRWIMMAPERLMLPDEVDVKRIRTKARIVASGVLRARFASIP